MPISWVSSHFSKDSIMPITIQARAVQLHQTPLTRPCGQLPAGSSVVRNAPHRLMTCYALVFFLTTQGIEGLTESGRSACWNKSPRRFTPASLIPAFWLVQALSPSDPAQQHMFSTISRKHSLRRLWSNQTMKRPAPSITGTNSTMREKN